MGLGQCAQTTDQSMPLLRSLAAIAASVAINMALLTELFASPIPFGGRRPAADGKQIHGPAKPGLRWEVKGVEQRINCLGQARWIPAFGIADRRTPASPAPIGSHLVS
jgi:hypothetical protein